MRSCNRLSLTPFPPNEDKPNTALLVWADYDLLPHALIHSNPSTILASSYIYRKSLIRKHFLLRTLAEWVAKCRQRKEIDDSLPECALEGAVPRGWSLELQFADELDELLADDLWDLNAILSKNGQVAEGEKVWFILKPSMSDRGQGIRLFSSREELEDIFQEFEDDSEDEAEDSEEDENEAMGDSKVATSQLRHFVVQEYLPNPLLLSPTEANGSGRKFHLRAYFCLSGAWTVLLSRTVLALFASVPYSAPIPECSLLPHLTNTCLQEELAGDGEATMGAENVLLLAELVGKTVLNQNVEHTVTAKEVEGVFQRVAAVGSEGIRAAIECGSIHMQLLPNAFEIFGVDFLVSLPANATRFVPVLSLLEFNASPDFHQSGTRLQKEITKMFHGIVQGVVRPFFKLNEEDVQQERSWNGIWEKGEERDGWYCAGKGEVRQW